MRLAILSDVHANLEALRATLAEAASAGADRLLCLGDIVGYNADPAPCIALLREAGAVCIAGNHDRAVAGLLATDDFPTTAVRAVHWTRARLGAEEIAFLAALPREGVVEGQVVAVHGALLPTGGCEMTRLDTPEARAACFEALAAHPSGARICAFGHTHRLALHERRAGRMRDRAGEELELAGDDALWLLNPGTVGQPRQEEWRASFMLLDTARRRVEVRRVAYDRAKALEKSRRAGLLPPRRTKLRAAMVWGLHRLGLYEAARRHVRGGG